jgi:chromosome segregation ATPase
MISLIAEHPALSVLAAFLLGYTIKWLLDLFVLRERLFTAEARAKRRGEELDSERFAHGRAQTDLKTKTSELEAQRRQREAAEATVAALQSRLAGVQTEAARLSARISQLEQELTAGWLARTGAETESREHAARAGDLALRLNAQDAELATAHATIESLRSQVHRLREENAFAAQRLPQLEQDLNHQNTTIGALKADLESALRGLADAQSAVGDLRTALTASQHGLEAARKARTELEESLQAQTAAALAATAEGTTLRQQLAKLQTQLQDVKSDSGPLEQRLRARQDDVKQLTVQLGEATEELAALKARAAQAEANLAAATETRGTLEREAAQRERELAFHGEKTAELEAELKAVSQAHADLQAELELRIQAATEAAVAQALAALPTPAPEPIPAAETVAVAVPAAPAPSSPSTDALLAELDQMSRERNELAAELAILRAGAPAEAPAAKPRRERKKKEKTEKPSEIDLGLLPTAAAESSPAAVPAPAAEPVATPVAAEDPVSPATVSSCPQPLSEVKGVDAILEQRLYAAGIGSYWSLAQLSDDELAGVLELGDTERAAIDLEDLRHDAARLARDTSTVGRRWNGTQPDDLERLEGLGPAHERRLYDAGICTYDALSTSDPETLASICPGHAGHAPDYAHWIAQARALLAARES